MHSVVRHAPPFAMIALALLGGACSEGASKRESAASEQAASAVTTSSATKKATAEPRPQTKLAATLNQQAVTMLAALAYQDSEGTGRVLVSSQPLDCAAVTGGPRAVGEDAVELEITLGQSLLPSGTLLPTVSGAYFRGMGFSGKTDPAKVSGTIAPGAPFSVDVDLALESAGRAADKLVATGTVEAIGCPAQKPSADRAPLPEPMQATIEIAGKKLPVRSAGIEGGERGGVTLSLSSGGDACSSATHVVFGELTVHIWYRAPTKDEPFEVRIHGTLPKQALDQTFDKKRVAVTPRPTVSEGEREYQLKADLLVTDYPVRLDGKVKAGVCPGR